MKISSWAATALATPAIAAGVCMLCAVEAQAAPDDTSASAGPARDSTSDSEATLSTSTRTESDSKPAKPRADDADADADTADLDTDADADEDDEDANAADQPSKVPNSTRTNSAETLVTLDVTDEEIADEGPVDEDPVDEDGGSDAAADDATDTVDWAVDQIAEARDDLNAATWDSGNVLAGLAALLPQMQLLGAQTSLERWQGNHTRLQEEFAATVNNPIAHWFARQRIEASIARTVRVQDQLDAAEKLLTVVGWFGPRESMQEIADLIDEASDNGLVYQILDLYMEDVDGVRRVNPIMKLSVNGGKYVNVLLDTGSVGLVINPQVIGLEDLGDPIGHGTDCYADCSVEYAYNTYNIPISVDDDVDSTRTGIHVVTLETWYALSETNSDYQGILGVGSNAGGSNNPLKALPGLLNLGVLMQERRGRAILGPNPYAARVTLEGAPRSKLTVKVGSYDSQVIDTWIDSGGIFGSVPRSLVDGADSVPAGTKISVYTEDGETLLFEYRTTRTNTPSVTPYSTDPSVIMGFPPFAAASIYVAFAGQGKTVFNYA